MGFIARLADARNKREGKILSVILAITLVLSMSNLLLWNGSALAETSYEDELVENQAKDEESETLEDVDDSKKADDGIDNKDVDDTSLDNDPEETSNEEGDDEEDTIIDDVKDEDPEKEAVSPKSRTKALSDTEEDDVNQASDPNTLNSNTLTIAKIYDNDSGKTLSMTKTVTFTFGFMSTSSSAITLSDSTIGIAGYVFAKAAYDGKEIKRLRLTRPSRTSTAYTLQYCVSASGSTWVDIDASDVDRLALYYEVEKITISFNANGGNGSVASISGPAETIVVLPDGSTLSRDGYEFLGWSSSKDDVVNGSNYQVVNVAGSSYEIGTTNETLYAVWAPTYISNEYITIALRKDGTIPGEPSIQYAEYDEVVKKLKVDNILDYFSPAHTIAGTALVQSALTDTFHSYVESKNIGNKFWNPDTQYVEWYVIKRQNESGVYVWHIDGVVRDLEKVSIVYVANDGLGVLPNSEQVNKGDDVDVADKGGLYKPGYEFDGWNTDSDGSGVSYNPGESIKLEQDLTLYAQWRKKNAVTISYVADPDKGSVSVSREQLVPELDKATGSKASAIKGYKFEGWYSDSEFENKVSDSAEYVPTEPAGGWIEATYYAKFVKDEEQTQTVFYKIVYTKDGVEQETIKVEGEAWINDNPAQIEIEKAGIPAPEDKYAGYVLDPENAIYPEAGTKVDNGETFYVNYIKRTDLSYTINYYKDEMSEDNMLGSTTVAEQTYKDEISLDDEQKNAKRPEGYKLGSVTPGKINIAADSGDNVFNVVYVPDFSDVEDWAAKFEGLDKTYDGQKSIIEPEGIVEGDEVKYFVEGVEVENEFVDVDQSATVTIQILRGTETKTVEVEVRITKAPLAIETPSAEKVYDGEALTKGDGWSIEGLVNGETATLVVTGSQTEVGSSENAYSIEWGSANKSNYKVVSEIIGTLNVTAKSITDPEDPSQSPIVGFPEDKVYTGEAQKWVPSIKVDDTDLVEDIDYTLSYSEDLTNVGTVTVTVEGRGNYAGSVTRTYRITKAPLAIETPSAEKVYDGEALTKGDGWSIEGLVNGETATLVVTGSQTEVGSSENAYSIEWGSAKESNYEIISETIGSLLVKENDSEIVVAAIGGTYTYDGVAHNASAFVSELPKGYTLAEAVSSANAVDVTEEPVEAIVDTLRILNAKGEDVTDRLNIVRVPSQIVIKPAELVVNTSSASKTYDGTSLTAAGTITGFIDGENAAFAVTGSQTEVGKSENTYTIDWEGASAKESNYSVKETIGELVVTSQSIDPKDPTKPDVDDPQKPVYVGVQIGGLENVVYNGVEQPQAPSVKNAEGDDLQRDIDYTLSYSEDLTNVGTVTVTVEGRGNYAGSVTRTYRITKAPLAIETPSAEKVYDGEALTKGDGWSIEGLVNGETATLVVTGSQTEVGSSENAYSIEWGSANKSNYKVVSEIIGTLTVKTQTIDPGTDPANPDSNYLGVEVGMLSDVVYNGGEQAQSPTVTDKDGNPLDTRFYDISFSNDVKNVGTVIVTIKGKNGYNGTIKRTYNITKARVVITVNDSEKIVGKKDPKFSGKISGTIYNDELGKITYTRNNKAEAVGSYKSILIPSYTANDNYDVIVFPGTFVIKRDPNSAPGDDGADDDNGGNPGDDGDGDNGDGDNGDGVGGGAGDGVGAGDGAAAPGGAGAGLTTIADNDNPLAAPVDTPADDAEEAIIADDENALGAFDDPECWVHWLMLAGIAVTIIYGAVVIIARRRSIKDIDHFEDQLIGGKRRRQDERAYMAPGAQII